jgi:hypothetical protein
MKTIEYVTNVAVILMAITVGTVYFKDYSRRSERVAKSAGYEQTLRGKTVKLPALHQGSRSLGVVLALSTRCEFCEKNAAFYRKLSQSKSGESFTLIASVPQTLEAARQYLDARRIEPDQIVAGAGAVPVPGTPTIMLVDSGGVVKDAWVGVLDQSREKEVIKKIREYCGSCVTVSE